MDYRLDGAAALGHLQGITIIMSQLVCFWEEPLIYTLITSCTFKHQHKHVCYK